MLEQLKDWLIVSGLALGIWFSAQLLNTIIGAVIAVKNGEKFQIKKVVNGLIEFLIMGIASEALIVILQALEWVTGKLGIDIKPASDGLTVVTLLVQLFGGTIYYLKNVYSNLASYFNPTNVIVEANDSVSPHEASQAIQNVLRGIYVKHDAGNGTEANESDYLAQMGAFPYYQVKLSTPDEFYNAVNGRGFDEGYGYQCVAGFKEFMYALSGKVVATWNGCASGYADQKSQIEPLGFTWHDGTDGIQNGDWAIFGGSEWGHVAMYYNGVFFGQNQGASDPYKGSPFNLTALGTGSIIGYYRPNIYVKPEPTPEPVPKKTEVEYTYQKGDTFGMVIVRLGLATEHGLWGEDGDVAYYDQQLHEQGIYGNIPIGTTIKLKKRP